MVQFQNVTKQYGAKIAVNNLSFEISEGEVLALLGPNGAGKSTSMKMLMGYIQPTSGGISVCGFDLQKNVLNAQANMGYLPEGTPLYTEVTVKEFLQFSAAARGVEAKQQKLAVEKVISLCGLSHVQQQLIDTLSKGYRQRTCFAQSIVHDPKVLIMDEPTDGLDPNQKQDIQDLIRDMAHSKQILLSTHIMEEAEYMADRILLLNHGQAQAIGSMTELRAQLGAQRRVELELDNDSIAATEQTGGIEGLSEVAALIQAELISLPAVAHIESFASSQVNSDTSLKFTLVAKSNDNNDVVQQILTFCQAQQLRIRSINMLETGLKQIFQALTKGESSASANPVVYNKGGVL